MAGARARHGSGQWLERVSAFCWHCHTVGKIHSLKKKKKITDCSLSGFYCFDLNLLNYYFMHMGFCLIVCMYVYHVYLGPMEARRGFQTPWAWSYSCKMLCMNPSPLVGWPGLQPLSHLSALVLLVLSSWELGRLYPGSCQHLNQETSLRMKRN